MPVGEEDPKIAMRDELNRRDTQQLLKEMRGKEGVQHNSEEYKAGYDYAFRLTDDERNRVLQHITEHGGTVYEAMKALNLVKP